MHNFFTEKLKKVFNNLKKIKNTTDIANIIPYICVLFIRFVNIRYYFQIMGENDKN